MISTLVLVFLAVALVAALPFAPKILKLLRSLMIPSDIQAELDTLKADLARAKSKEDADAATIAGLEAKVAAADADKAAALAAQAAEFKASLDPLVASADALATAPAVPPADPSPAPAAPAVDPAAPAAA